MFHFVDSSYVFPTLIRVDLSAHVELCYFFFPDIFVGIICTDTVSLQPVQYRYNLRDSLFHGSL